MCTQQIDGGTFIKNVCDFLTGVDHSSPLGSASSRSASSVQHPAGDVNLCPKSCEFRLRFYQQFYSLTQTN